MKEKTEKCLNVATIIFGVLIIFSLIYFAIKQQDGIIQIKYDIWKIGVFINSWVIVAGWFKFKELGKQNKIIAEQNRINTEQTQYLIEKEKIQSELMEDMRKMLEIIKEENMESHHELTKLHLNTRKLLLETQIDKD